MQSIRKALSAEAAAEPLPNVPDSLEDEALLRGSEEMTAPDAVQRTPLAPQPGNDGLSVGSVVAIAASVIAVVLVCVVAAFMLAHRHRFGKRSRPFQLRQTQVAKVCNNRCLGMASSANGSLQHLYPNDVSVRRVTDPSGQLATPHYRIARGLQHA